jgi:hypothetical protein
MSKLIPAAQAAQVRADIIKIQGWAAQFWKSGENIEDPEIQKLVSGLMKCSSGPRAFHD